MAKIILITNQKGGVGKSTLAFNLANNLKNSARVAIIDADNQRSIYKLKDNLDFDVLNNEALKNLHSLDYDLIFVDTPGALLQQVSELSDIANLILVPTKPGVYDLMAINETLDMIKEKGHDKKTLIVLNMVKSKSTITDDIQKHLNTYNVKVANTRISDLVTFARSPITKGIIESNALKQLDNLTKEVLMSII